MSTENTNLPAVKPAITEADVVGFLRAYIGRIVNGRPLHHISFGVSSHHGRERPELSWIYVSAQAVDHDGERQCGAGSSIQSAIKSLADDIKVAPAPEVLAKKKRDAAAKLLAEAEQLETATKETATKETA